MERGWPQRSDAIAIALVISFLLHSLLVLGAVFFAAHREPLLERLARGAVEVELAPPPGATARAVELPVAMPPRPAPLAVPPARTEPLPRPLAKLREPVPAPEPKPEPKKPEEKPEPVKVELVQVDRSRLKMVEVQNPESETPPDDARFLSDKNRRVREETRAVHTNLEKDHPRPAPSSDPSGKEGKTPGGKEERIAETREQKSRPGAREQAPRVGPLERPSPLLAMRKAGAPGAPAEDPRSAAGGALPPAPSTSGQGGEGGKARRSRAGLDLDLDHKSLDRIDGKAAKQARELARLSPSVKKGKFERKWQAVRAALENFVPEVKPGNQTALGTRADPFAVYIARMHRKIHKLWGFGFLPDLDLKPDSNPMNNMKLWTMVEVVLRPTGEVDKATIVRPSGYLPYDVAALDTVLSSGPYEPTPRAIRSADGKVYLHWRFHRDQRQCGTFGVDPFILTTPPKGPVDNPYGEVKNEGPGRELRRLHAPKAPRAPSATRATPPAASPPSATPSEKPASAKPGTAKPAGGPAESARVDPKDPAARALLGRFAAAFAAGNARAMTAGCGFPFLAHGRSVAKSAAELERQLGDLLREAGGRRASVLRVMSVAQARAALGRQVEGTEHGASQLVAELALGKLSVIAILERRKSGFLVVGLNRGGREP